MHMNGQCCPQILISMMDIPVHFDSTDKWTLPFSYIGAPFGMLSWRVSYCSEAVGGVPTVLMMVADGQ